MQLRWDSRRECAVRASKRHSFKLSQTLKRSGDFWATNLSAVATDSFRRGKDPRGEQLAMQLAHSLRIAENKCASPVDMWKILSAGSRSNDLHIHRADRDSGRGP